MRIMRINTTVSHFYAAVRPAGLCRLWWVTSACPHCAPWPLVSDQPLSLGTTEGNFKGSGLGFGVRP